VNYYTAINHNNYPGDYAACLRTPVCRPASPAGFALARERLRGTARISSACSRRRQLLPSTCASAPAPAAAALRHRPLPERLAVRGGCAPRKSASARRPGTAPPAPTPPPPRTAGSPSRPYASCRFANKIQTAILR